MKNKFNFTFAVVRDLPSPAKGKRAYYYDTKIPGLELRVTTSGVKTFNVFKWLKGEGRARRIQIGRFPDLDIADARKIAAQKLVLLASGVNPADERRQAREEMTLADLFHLVSKNYYEPYRPKSVGDYTRVFSTHLAPLRNRRLSEITRADVQALHAKIGKVSGIYAANKSLRVLSLLFNKARDYGFEKSNPAQRITKFRERSRDRFLQASELPRFFEALQEEKNETLRDFVMIALLTGARRSNVASMRWQDINFADCIWTIQETKNGTAQRVPLMPEALRILEERSGNDSEFVFESPNSVNGYINDPKRGWKRILERAGIDDLRIHDLRRSLGSWQAATGASLTVIGKTLNHKNIATTAIYARLNLDPVRESMATATKAMFEVGGVAQRNKDAGSAPKNPTKPLLEKPEQRQSAGCRLAERSCQARPKGVKEGNPIPDVDIDIAIARKKAFEADPRVHTCEEEAENN